MVEAPGTPGAPLSGSHAPVGPPLACDPPVQERLLPQPVMLVPVGPGAYPDLKRRVAGTAVELTEDGLTIELGAGDAPEASFILLFRDEDGSTSAAGLVSCSQEALSSGQVRLRAQFGGIGHELLRPQNLMPRLGRETLRLSLGFPLEVLQEWEAAGVLESVALDPLRLCPRCSSLPEFVRGCRRCGSTRSARLATFRCVECAFVAAKTEFETSTGFQCPSCGAADLVPGSSVLPLPGAYRCLGCGAGETELGYVASCSACGARFSEEEAVVTAQHGYRARALALRRSDSD